MAALMCDQGYRSGKSWEDRSVVLDDRDVLHWVVETVSGVDQAVLYYRTDRSGSVPAAVGAGLLRQHRHRDADLLQPVGEVLDEGSEAWHQSG